MKKHSLKFGIVSTVLILKSICPINAQVTDLVAFCSQLKGFNLLGKFDVNWSNKGYSEEDFSLIKQLGFNFVRLPIDYRTYTREGDWDTFIETQVQQIDQAINWGINYNIHVCMNLHRAPGFCVNSAPLPPNQQLNLWTDTVAQNAFVNHWKYFAKRYKSVPSESLSFNLVNEPYDVTEDVYVQIMEKAINAIHDISPDRIIFIDGLDYGRWLIPALKSKPNVAQAIHCYDPFKLTHYQANWVNGSSNWSVPVWPMYNISAYLYGPWKSELKSSLTIEGHFPRGTEIIVNVGQVSIESTLAIKTDREQILEKKFTCTSDPGDDFTKVIETAWGYQNVSNKSFCGTLNEDATRVSFSNISGDWMTINSIAFKTKNKTKFIYPCDFAWGKKQATYLLDNSIHTATDGIDLLPFKLYKHNIQVAKEHKIAFMVQEFGVYNKTPHTVALYFLSDLIKLFRENKIGWALWNFTGPFGILNSGRADCNYELFQGYQLDKKLLNILTAGNTLIENEIDHTKGF